MVRRYFLGCPMWGNKDWKGIFLSRKARNAEFLAEYSSVFNTVEGNTTFYGLPGEEAVAKWCDAAPPDFRFCFKFPKQISHVLRLRDAERETDAFFNRLTPLGRRLGPFFLQLPPSFGAGGMNALADYLAALPKHFTYAVEVRHEDFFTGGAVCTAFEDLLASHRVDRVIFDARNLQSMKSSDPDILTAQRKKPKLPPRISVTGPRPFVRYVGDPVIENDDAAIAAWVRTTAGWLEAGLEPYIFIHHVPEDVEAPRLARIFHQKLQALIPDVGDMPSWPIENDRPEHEQLSLF